MKSNIYVDGTYSERAKGWHTSESPWKAKKVLRMIERNNLCPGSIYDIGCGAGQILVELQSKLGPAVELVGFDISPQAISMAKTRESATLRFLNEDFLATERPPSDLLLLLDVFEHVPDYISFLDSLRKRTNWIIFHIPLDMCAKSVLQKSNWMMWMRETYGHLHYFSKETAFATLSDVGFKTVDYFYTDDYEITDNMIPKTPKRRILYEFRKRLSRKHPGLAASIFEHFNLMVLARGDNGTLR